MSDNVGFYSGSDQGTINWSPTSATGTLTFITGTALLTDNTPINLTVACNQLSGAVFGTTEIDVTGTISPDGTQLSGTYTVPALPGNDGTWRSAAVSATVSTTGTTLTTDASSSGATVAAPLQTSVVSPNAGALQIDQALVPGSVVAGYSLLNQTVRITAPDATAANPLAFTFEIDASITGGASAASIAVFRNGVLVGDCTGASGTAAPDPCVSARVDLPNGNVQMSVLTSHASVWTLGTPPRTVSVGSAAVVEGQTGKGRTISFPVTLSEPSGGVVHVQWRTQDGSANAGADYTARTGTVTFKPSPRTHVTNTTAYITTTVAADSTPAELDETFSVVLVNVDGGYSLDVPNATATGTILTDDSDPVGSVGIGDVAIVEGGAGKGNTAKVTVELSEPASTPTTIMVSLVPAGATAGTDYKALKPKTLKFNVGQWQKAVAVTVLPDTAAEGNEFIDLVLSSPSPGLTIVRGTGHLTILDDD